MGQRGRVVVVAAVVERGGRVLVSQRGPDGGQAGRWEFPGGKREPGEDDRTALRRELAEELGVDLPVGDMVWRSAAGPLELRFYRCGWPPGLRPRALDVAQFRWVRREDLAALRFPPADDALVDALVRGDVPPAGGGTAGRSV